MAFNINLRNSVIGLDIGSYSIKLAELRRGLKEIELLNYYECPLQSSDDGEADISGILKSIFTEKQLYGKRVVTSIPDDRVTFRFLTLPFTDKKKINSIIKYEVEGQLPFSSDEIIVDSIYLGSDNGKASVLAAITTKEVLQERLNILSAAGIDPEIIDINLLAVSNFAKYKIGNLADNCMILDIGNVGTSLLIINKGRVKLIKSISLMISIIDETWDREILDKLIREIKRILLCFNKEQGEEINKIILSGRKISPDIKNYITEKLNMETRYWDPSEGLNNDKNLLIEGYISAASIGLGLRGINGHINGFNLRKNEFARKHIFETMGGAIKTVMIMIGVILSLFMCDVYFKKWSLENRYLLLKDEGRRIFQEAVPGVRKIVNEAHQLNAKLNEIKKNYELIGGYSGERHSSLDYLLNITNSFPKDGNSAIFYYSFSKDEIRLEGKAGSFESIDNIKKELVKEDGIQKIKVTEARLGADQVSVKFKMTILLNEN